MLTKAYVAHFTRHYKQLVEEGAVNYSRGIDMMFLDYWGKAK